MMIQTSVDYTCLTKKCNNTSTNPFHSLVSPHIFICSNRRNGWELLPRVALIWTLESAADALYEPNYQANYPILQRIGELAGFKFDEHEMCPACMIGKSKMKNGPVPAKRARRPLGKVNFDLIASTFPSIGGYFWIQMVIWTQDRRKTERIAGAVKNGKDSRCNVPGIPHTAFYMVK
jgi:hypothetical protein